MAFGYDDARYAYDQTLSAPAGGIHGYDPIHSSVVEARTRNASGLAARESGTALQKATRFPGGISSHAATRMSQRGISEKMAATAVRKGDRYYDRAHDTIAHVLPGGFASGKTLQVATDPATGRLVTVIDKSPNFVPDPSRYVPLGPGG